MTANFWSHGLTVVQNNNGLKAATVISFERTLASFLVSKKVIEDL
jgi:hypothetical protein